MKSPTWWRAATRVTPMADDELALRRDAARASRAQALLSDDLFNEAFDALRQRYVDLWLGSDARDDDGRARCWLGVKNLELVKAHLHRVVSDGQIAVSKIEFMEAKAKREKRA